MANHHTISMPPSFKTGEPAYKRDIAALHRALLMTGGGEQLWCSTNNDPPTKGYSTPSRSSQGACLIPRWHASARMWSRGPNQQTWEAEGAVFTIIVRSQSSESWYSGKGRRTKPAVTSESEQACSSNKEMADGSTWRGCSWTESEQRSTPWRQTRALHRKDMRYEPRYDHRFTLKTSMICLFIKYPWNHSQTCRWEHCYNQTISWPNVLQLATSKDNCTTRLIWKDKMPLHDAIAN
jgi:hypothetical protein